MKHITITTTYWGVTVERVVQTAGAGVDKLLKEVRAAHVKHLCELTGAPTEAVLNKLLPDPFWKRNDTFVFPYEKRREMQRFREKYKYDPAIVEGHKLTVQVR